MAAENTKPSDTDLVEGFNYIVIRRSYLAGKPALRSKRISVSQILDALANGSSPDDLWDAYRITKDEVIESLRYAASITDQQIGCQTLDME